MDHFPIYIRTSGGKIVLSGGGDAALAKLRLLLKTQADLVVFARDPDPRIAEMAREGRLRLERREVTFGDLTGAILLYAADEDDLRDQRTVDLGRAAGILVNHVDNLENSSFITPAIVDRAPVTIAIGTEGAAPVLARALKAELEERLDPGLGVLARIGKGFRSQARRLAPGRARRAFWATFYNRTGPEALGRGGVSAVLPALESLLSAHLEQIQAPGRIDLIGTGDGAADMLSLRARKVLDLADVVVADAEISTDILELARREALFLDPRTGAGSDTGTVTGILTGTLTGTLINKARSGARIVLLKPGAGTPDTTISEAAQAGIETAVLPGLPFGGPAQAPEKPTDFQSVYPRAHPPAHLSDPPAHVRQTPLHKHQGTAL